MIILKKKRLYMIIVGIFVAVGILEIGITRNKNATVSTVALPVSNKVIVIDAGHGVPDEGAQSSNGTTEAETNLKIALKVQNLLEQSGSTVILTRRDENAIYDLDKKTLKEKNEDLLKLKEEQEKNLQESKENNKLVKRYEEIN